LFPSYAFGSYALAKGERIAERFRTVGTYAFTPYLLCFVILWLVQLVDADLLL